MKVGIFVTNQNPLGTDMVSALDEQLAMTRLARDRGWDAVGTGQHYLSEGLSQLQLIPFLGRLAAEAGEMTGAPCRLAHSTQRAVAFTQVAERLGAQPRAARAGLRVPRRVVRVVGCGGLSGLRRLERGFPLAFACARARRRRSVSFTAAESRKTAATSGSRSTTFVPWRYRL